MRSFLQTIEWLEFQKSLGRSAWRYEQGAITANIIRHDLPFGKNYLYIPHGPEIVWGDIQGGIRDELQKFVAYLKSLASEQKSFYIKMEPLDDKVPEMFHQFGFKKSKKELQPKRSVVLDLAETEEELLAGMHHKTRYNIKVAEKRGVSTAHSDDVGTFFDLLKKTTERQKFSAHSHSYYKKLFNFFSANPTVRAEIILAMVDGKPAAGGLMVLHEATCYYLHGGSDYAYHQAMAPYALHWHAIREMKQRGFVQYDFGGSEATKWRGITRFKLGWGSREVEYPGSFDLPISKFWYYTYKLIRRR